jgi:hypothetical protein
MEKFVVAHVNKCLGGEQFPVVDMPISITAVTIKYYFTYTALNIS